MKTLNVTTAIALALGFGLVSAIHPAAAQVDRQDAPAFCDDDGNGWISATEAENCAERGYTEFRGDEEYMTREQFGTAFPEATDAESIYNAADANGDGQVTEEEWRQWHQQSFTERSQGEDMSVEDYETWYSRGMTD